MAQIMPELAWAFAFLTHGAVAMYSATTQRCNRVTLCLDALLGVLLWSTATIACFVAHWTGSWHTYAPPAAMAGEIWIMAFSWWYYVRHWADFSTLQGAPRKRKGYE